MTRLHHDRLGGYARLSISDRKEAALELKAEGCSNREAAEVLGVAEGTIRGDLSAQNYAPADENDNGINVAESESAQNYAPTKAEKRAAREAELAAKQIALPEKR